MEKLKKLFKIDEIFIYIFKISLIYLSPTQVSQMRNKGKYKNEPEKIYKGLVINNYGIGSLVILFVYSLIFLAIDFNRTPYLLDYSLVFIMILNLLQTFTYFYNVFYESKDLESYMNLPIEESALFSAKLLAISLGTVQMSVPIIAITTIFFLKMGLGVISIIYSLIEFFIFGALSVMINMVITQILVKSSVLSRLKKRLMTIVSILAMVLNVAFIILIQNIGKVAALKSIQNNRVIYGPVSKMIDSHMGNLIFIILGAIVVFMLYKIIMKSINGSYFDYIKNIQGDFSDYKYYDETIENGDNNIDIRENTSGDMNEVTRKIFETSKKRKKNVAFSSGSLRKIFIRYNLTLLDEQNIIVTSIISPAIFPIIVIVSSFLSNNGFNMVGKDFITRILVGVALALLMATMSTNQNISLPAIMISLDRENLDYIKSLPINMKRYLNIKLLVSSSVMSVIPTISFIIIGVLNNIGFLGIIVGIIVIIPLIICISFYWLRYDYGHAITNWQNVTELYYRIGRAWMMLLTFISVFLLVLGFIIIGGLASFGYSDYILTALLILICIFFLYTYGRYREFIKKFD